MPHKRTTPEEFWQRTDRSGGPAACWPWLGGYRNADGYGRLKYHRKTWVAHRLAWTLANDMTIPEGLVVMHSCDNPPCCNPAHLRPGTSQENTADRDHKGRTAKGDTHYTQTRPDTVPRGSAASAALITEAAVVDIRRLYAAGNLSQAAIGRMFGLAQPTISEIIRRTSWAHVH